MIFKKLCLTAACAALISVAGVAAAQSAPSIAQVAENSKEAVPTAFDPVAHKRVLGISEQLRCLVCQNQSIADSNAELAVDLRNQVIYYAGPCPAKPGDSIGACGPTTSYRMDAYAPTLCDLGLIGMIGKGQRSEAVASAIRRNGGVYFAATGGAGALIASCVKAAEVIAFDDLGTEAIRRLTVEDLPLIVAIDAQGGNLYESGPAQYRR